MTPVQKLEEALLGRGSRRGHSNGTDTVWTCPVPGHGKGRGDRNKSLAVTQAPDGNALVCCHAGCSIDEVLAVLGLKKSDLFPQESRKQPERKQPEKIRRRLSLVTAEGTEPALTLEAYSEAKKLPVKFLSGLGLKENSFFGGPSLSIPYFAEDGSESAIRYRLHLNKGPRADTRFKWKRGSKTMPYGLQLLNEARTAGEIVLVEGLGEHPKAAIHDHLKTGLHEKACRVNSEIVFIGSTAVAGASEDVSFDQPPGFHSHSSRVRFPGPVHDEVRGVRALQSVDRPRRSAAFTQSPGQGGLEIEFSVPRFRNPRRLDSLLCAPGSSSGSFYAAWPCCSL